jgi:hypothetical protein
MLMGMPKGKRPPGRYRRRWESNIKKNLREIGWGDTDWIYLVQDRDQWRGHEASGSIKCWEILE